MSIPNVELYILSSTRAGRAALEHFKRLRARVPPDRAEWSVVDLDGAPEAAAPDRLLALPTLVSRVDQVERRCFGDFADVDATLSALGLGALPVPT